MSRSVQVGVEDEFTMNERRIGQLKVDLDDSLIRRDYVFAARTQRELEKAVVTQRDYVVRTRRREDAQELERLEQRRRVEEVAMHKDVIQRAKIAVCEFERRLSAMEARQSAEIQALEAKASEPGFGLPRLSPDLTSAARAEQAYAKRGEWRNAAFAYQEVLEVTERQYALADGDADAAIEKLVRMLVSQHDREKRRFLEAVVATKDELDRSIVAGLEVIRNKYGKHRRRILGKEHDPLPDSTRTWAVRVYHSLDDVFAPLLDRIPTLCYIQVPPASPREQRKGRVQRALTKVMTQHLQRAPRTLVRI